MTIHTFALTKRDAKRVRSIVRRGTAVVKVTNTDNGNYGVFYAVMESRGAQTNYQPQRFYTLIVHDSQGVPFWICGLTNDSRRKTMSNYWEDKSMTVSVYDSELFNDLIS